MGYVARFLYDIYEEKYAINPYFSWGYKKDSNWYLGDEYTGRSSPLGYKATNVMRYERIKQNDVILHTEEIDIEFQAGNKVKIKNENVNIIDVVKNLDGSIDYFTNKKEFISLNTRDSYFDERKTS